jgi:hypothetical protein
MKRLPPLGILFAIVALFSIFQFASVTLGTSDPEIAALLTSIGLSLAFVIWMMADARIRRRTPCYEFGFLVWVYFPLSLIWYVVWSRGWRAVFVLTGLFALMLLPRISTVMAWVLRYGLD